MSKVVPKSAKSTASAAPAERRRYDSPLRRQQLAETRERILAAASELVHGFASWDWRELTSRAVAERAGVGERTVYRHFRTERELHDAVMQRLQQEAGICYEEVSLDNIHAVTARIFASLSRFSVPESVATLDDPTFRAEDQRRRAALRTAVADAAPGWTAGQRDAVAALLDALWNPLTYGRLVAQWRFEHDRAAGAIGWLIDLVLQQVAADAPPPA